MIVMPHYKYFVTDNKALLLQLLYPLQMIVIPIINTLLPIINVYY